MVSEGQPTDLFLSMSCDEVTKQANKGLERQPVSEPGNSNADCLDASAKVLKSVNDRNWTRGELEIATLKENNYVKEYFRFFGSPQ